MKGIGIVVHGSVGHMSAFLAQSGALVVLGRAGEALGDSLDDARFVLRADCVEKEMRVEYPDLLADLLQRGEAAHLALRGNFITSTSITRRVTDVR